MADRTSAGTLVWLAVLIGVLVVALAAVSYGVYVARHAKEALPRSINIELNAPRPPSLPDLPKMPNAPLPTPK